MLKRLITLIFALQLVFMGATYPNTLSISEQGEVRAETDRYLARFEMGVLVHFHNKLTQETYTQGKSDANTQIKVRNGGVATDSTIPEIRRLSPLECRLIYQKDDEALRLFIRIDEKTGDILIRQIGISEKGHLERIMWGFGNLSHRTVDLILPIDGGQRLSKNAESRRLHYPGTWEAQLAILQGQRGGVFVHSDDTQYQFKTLEYSSSENENFTLNFWHPPLLLLTNESGS